MLWDNRGRFDPWTNWPHRNIPTTETHFGCIERKLRLLWISSRRVEGTKKWKKHARVQLHPYAHRTPPPFAAVTIFCVSGWMADAIKQNSGELVHGFRSPRPFLRCMTLFEALHGGQQWAVIFLQWCRNRWFRRFNEPGPPSSWSPRVVEPQKNFRQNS